MIFVIINPFFWHTILGLIPTCHDSGLGIHTANVVLWQSGWQNKNKPKLHSNNSDNQKSGVLSRELPINGHQKWLKIIKSTGKPAEKSMTVRPEPERVKGKASY